MEFRAREIRSESGCAALDRRDQRSDSCRPRLDLALGKAARVLMMSLYFLVLGIAAAVSAQDAASLPNRCATNAGIASLTSSPSWNGWGADAANTRFQPAGAAQLSAADVPHLKLKWAFGFPGARAVSGQPAVVAGRVFVSADTGDVYALDATSGCVYWSFHADAAVRSSVTVDRPAAGRPYAVFFGDAQANAYALDAATGVPL